ncbi:MAG: hypothetical protein DRJ40_10845 [Thermoprotei archaeon]|nr:MAG: hypothetical protein DRJ40_10845 [Thermoprotei archaeon]
MKVLLAIPVVILVTVSILFLYCAATTKVELIPTYIYEAELFRATIEAVKYCQYSDSKLIDVLPTTLSYLNLDVEYSIINDTISERVVNVTVAYRFVEPDYGMKYRYEVHLYLSCVVLNYLYVANMSIVEAKINTFDEFSIVPKPALIRYHDRYILIFKGLITSFEIWCQGIHIRVVLT